MLEVKEDRRASIEDLLKNPIISQAIKSRPKRTPRWSITSDSMGPEAIVEESDESGIEIEVEETFLEEVKDEVSNDNESHHIPRQRYPRPTALTPRSPPRSPASVKRDLPPVSRIKT